jgi:hypothetical protein
MIKDYSLYIDHQDVAGLIRGLEEVYQAHRPIEGTLSKPLSTQAKAMN